MTQAVNHFGMVTEKGRVSAKLFEAVRLAKSMGFGTERLRAAQLQLQVLALRSWTALLLASHPHHFLRTRA